jgi:hypothetical protein
LLRAAASQLAGTAPWSHTAPLHLILMHVMQGPAAYNVVVTALGKQPVSTRPSSAYAHFGTSSRVDARAMAARGTPGPGAYDTDVIDGVAGRAATSARPRSAVTRIGTASRFRGELMGSPGPAYNPDISPVRGRMPAYSFGSGARDGSAPPRPGSPTRITLPGPGAVSSHSERRSCWAVC